MEGLEDMGVGGLEDIGMGGLGDMTNIFILAG